MMPIALAAFGERSAVGLVSGRIEQFSRCAVPVDPIALEITDVGAQRARRTHPPHHSRFDNGTAGAVVEEARGGKARRAPAPKPAVARGAAPRETAGLLRGSQCLRQEGFCPRRACRADAARTDAKIVVTGHVGLTECRKLSGNNSLLKIASCAGCCTRFA